MNQVFIRKGNLVVVMTGLATFAALGYFIGSRRSAPPAPSAPAATPKEKDASAEEPGLVRLDPAAVKNAGIRVEAVRVSPVRATLTVPGVVAVSPGRVARITPPVAGKAIRVLVNLGETVRAGQPLLVLDSYEVAQAQAAVGQAQTEARQADARLRTAEADAQKARVQAGSAQTALGRQRELAQTGAFSQPALQTAQNELNQAESDEQQAQTALQAATTVVQRAERLFKEQLIAQAEREQAQTQERQEETRLKQAQKRVVIARQTLERERTVFGRGLLSSQAVQSAEAEVRAAQADVRRAEREVAGARTALAGARDAVRTARANQGALVGSRGRPEGGGRVTVLAPLRGVVTERAVTLGEAVERTGVLLVLQNLASVVVQANVPEKDVARVRVGLPVTVTVAAYPNRAFGGIVESIASAVDEKTRTLPVRCRLDNPSGRLKPEMFAQVRLATGNAARRSALLVPQSALVDDGGQQVLFVAEGGGYEKRMVQVSGDASADRVEVTHGVAPGEKVVTAGAFLLLSESRKGELKEEE